MTEPSEQPEQENETADGPPDAVLVIVERDDSGKLAARVQPMGDVRITEVETVLGSALANWRTANRLPT